MYIATTTVSILRGHEEDEYGDEKQSDNAVYRGIPASIMEQRSARSVFAGRRLVRSGSTVDPRTVRFLTCRLPPNTDVNVDDRIKDEQSGVVYIIDSKDKSQSGLWPLDTRLELRLPE